MLFSVKPQHVSAIGIHISPPFSMSALSKKRPYLWRTHQTTNETDINKSFYQNERIFRETDCDFKEESGMFAKGIIFDLHLKGW